MRGRTHRLIGQTPLKAILAGARVTILKTMVIATTRYVIARVHPVYRINVEQCQVAANSVAYGTSAIA